MLNEFEKFRSGALMRLYGLYPSQLFVTLCMLLGFMVTYSVVEMIRHIGFHPAHWMGAVGGAATGYLLGQLILMIKAAE